MHWPLMSDIFSHSVGYIFTPLIVSFNAQKIFILMTFNSSFLLVFCDSGVCPHILYFRCHELHLHSHRDRVNSLKE